MKTLLVGDILDFKVLNKLIEKKKPRIVIACGKTGLQDDVDVSDLIGLKTPIYLCGDKRDDVDYLRRNTTLPGGYLLSDCTAIRWVPCGTCFPLPSKHLILFAGLPWYSNQTLEQSIRYMWTLRVSVVVSSESPSSWGKKTTRGDVLDMTCMKCKPTRWFSAGETDRRGRTKLTRWVELGPLTEKTGWTWLNFR